MPLSPSDIHYLNRLIEKRLKYARSWPTLRYFILGSGIFMIAMGLWSGSMAASMTRQFDFSFRLPAAQVLPAHDRSLKEN